MEGFFKGGSFLGFPIFAHRGRLDCASPENGNIVNGNQLKSYPVIFQPFLRFAKLLAQITSKLKMALYQAFFNHDATKATRYGWLLSAQILSM